ncbi:tetratricopeptide repeat protein [Sporosarcina saromensis]|uniref:Tetratricopeptide repeat protein n=1 Tax=Sporosarcina saromensis TaxID=359365 RepID=A0ABU4G8G8_9BACL|nr:tetratricopeptide repeat protein [Sporosarcina saromensis]MDW0113278.1 tetratricopeptide repeat protein [Sporosarcina saromensis]
MDIQTLKEELAALTETIYFDEQNFLREHSSDPLQLRRVIDLAEQAVKSNEDERFFLYGTLGNLYRILGEPKMSIHYLKLNLLDAENSRSAPREIVTLIRLGEALKYDGRHEEAMEMFNRASLRCEETDDTIYRDFVLQHKGKCLLEMHKVDEAMECFRRALTLRMEKGDVALIHSTERALVFARKLLASDGNE